ncbi:hypothetical protein BDY19DRAFT_108616 [Irpex rosettiformis]|uniref:Uncharacterized protein n=1 Tax=Irpex rosettiformis TaxID=378272 RepID=A0ACB8U5D5_9APHY|nr:hypothetical protein BDY19DRAFT_108616 [Irpex rosettiformis]
MYRPDPAVVAKLAKGNFSFKVDGKSLSLSSDMSPASSKTVLRDDELPYEDFHHAQSLLIETMEECPKYSRELINGLADMFHALDRHGIRKQEFGDLAVQRYATIVRMEWHSKLKDRTIFDIAKIGDFRLRSIHRRIVDEESSIR